MNQGTLTLLKDMEGMGLIHIQATASPDNAKTEPDSNRHNRWLRGCCKNLPEGSVDNFLADCRADKERELAIEERRGRA